MNLLLDTYKLQKWSLLRPKIVEKKHDVIILLDSITRLARAYNSTQAASGKILTGGVDVIFGKTKRFFGAVRNMKASSLTTIATALIDTGSRMDEVIFEEFGTVTKFIWIELLPKRIFPAINIRRSGTRREELITDDAELARINILRKLLHEMEDIDATDWLIDKLSNTKQQRILRFYEERQVSSVKHNFFSLSFLFQF